MRARRGVHVAVARRRRPEVEDPHRGLAVLDLRGQVLERRLRLLLLPALVVGVVAVAQRHGVARLERQRLLGGGGGLGVLLLVEVEAGEGERRRHQLGIELRRLLELGDGGGLVAGVEGDDAGVVGGDRLPGPLLRRRPLGAAAAGAVRARV